MQHGSSSERARRRTLRSAAEDRVLRFEAAEVAVEVEIRAGQLEGQIVPPGPGEVYVETASGLVIGVQADDLGFFMVPRLPAERFRVRCDTSNARAVSDWVIP